MNNKPPLASESALHYPLGDQLPDLGSSIEVAPGVRWLRMKLPFALDHINLWLLRDEIDGVDGWTIVDCGIANDETKAAWDKIFANELNGLPVLRVIVTHMHPDHVGLSQWLCEKWKAPLWISMTDYLTAQWLSHKGWCSSRHSGWRRRVCRPFSKTWPNYSGGFRKNSGSF